MFFFFNLLLNIYYDILIFFANAFNIVHSRVSDNQLSGKFPDFIQKWTKLERL